MRQAIWVVGCALALTQLVICIVAYMTNPGEKAVFVSDYLMDSPDSVPYFVIWMSVINILLILIALLDIFTDQNTSQDQVVFVTVFGIGFALIGWGTLTVYNVHAGILHLVGFGFYAAGTFIYLLFIDMETGYDMYTTTTFCVATCAGLAYVVTYLVATFQDVHGLWVVVVNVEWVAVWLGAVAHFTVFAQKWWNVAYGGAGEWASYQVIEEGGDGDNKPRNQ